MSADKLAEALKKLISGYVTLLQSGREKILEAGGSCDSVERMADGSPVLREARQALAVLTAEQRRLGMYEKQEPVLVHAGSSEMLACFDKLAAARNQDRLDAERYRELRPGRHWSVIDWIGNDLRGDVLDVAIDKAIAAKEAKP